MWIAISISICSCASGRGRCNHYQIKEVKDVLSCVSQVEQNEAGRVRGVDAAYFPPTQEGRRLLPHSCPSELGEGARGRPASDHDWGVHLGCPFGSLFPRSSDPLRPVIGQSEFLLRRGCALLSLALDILSGHLLWTCWEMIMLSLLDGLHSNPALQYLPQLLTAFWHNFMGSYPKT